MQADGAERPETWSRVRCPAGDCARVFVVPDEKLGRNVHCLECGARMTARPLAVERRLERIEAAAPAGGRASSEGLARLPLAVVVDNVRSLWNVGSIFRTADACGVSQIVLCGITGTPPREGIAKTALGAEHSVPWTYRADPRDALAGLAAQGFVTVAVERSPAAPPVDLLRWPERVCLVIGNEVAGVGPRTREMCEVETSIPMLGMKESLNVAVAFGIAAYSASRALGARARGEVLAR
jgi:23S rRNA (guanosine2251-2'-O)-methyltransferase